MKKSVSIFLVLVFLALLTGCAGEVSHHGYLRDESPAYSVNESHGLDYYQMYGY